MKRLLFILCLICSTEVFAQHYTVEYWFDQNYGSRDTVSMDTSAWQMQIDVEHLNGGTHMLHMQIRDTARNYCAPRSFLFYNSSNIDSVTYRMWFDQDYSNYQTEYLGDGATLIDINSLANGLHTMNLQIGSGQNAELLGYIFYKLMVDTGVTPNIEYTCWFDQDYTNRQTGTLNNGNILIDVDSLDNGVHTINWQLGGEDDAELHSYLFYKHTAVDSVFSHTEYMCWFDQGLDNRQSGILNSGNFLLDVDTLENGVHLLNVQLGTGMQAELHSYIFYNASPLDSSFSNAEYVCWFDQNYANRQAGTLGSGNFLLDVDSLTAGTHILNLQLGDGLNAELHSYIFYKTFSPDSVFPNVEYACWFDRNYSNRQTGALGSGNLLFDVDSLDGGIHIFNLQFGDGLDAELHSYVFYKELDYDSIFRNTEYVRWFDQDYANRQVGVVDSGYMLIDISSMTIGPHYLNLQFGDGPEAELRSFLFYKVETFYDTAILDVCDWTLWYDSIYTVSGEYGQERDAILPNCYDTVATLYLNVRYSSTGDTAATVCDSLLWYGNTYTESASPVHHTTNMAGCDSTTTLNLTVNYSTLGDTMAIVCDSFMWYGITYNADTMPVYHTTNALGCDSTITLNLTVNYATVGDTFAVVCDSFMWHSVTYTADTMPVYHLPNALGCDSTLTLNLTILQSSVGDTMAIACDRFDWYGTEYYESSDSATYTLTNAVGCDSVVTLYLTINHSTVDTIVTSATGSYEWQGFVLDSSGTYLDSLQTVDGCDSILVLQLTILQGIQEVGDGIISVYPNPTSGRIKVAADDVTRIDVYNVNGQLVRTTFKESVIDISTLPSGVYMLKVETAQSKYVCRVIKR